MANQTFEHSFLSDGSLTFRLLNGKRDEKPTHVNRYQVAPLGADVCAVSYLGSAGYTLTAVLDYHSGQLVAFASNEKDHVLQHGTFEEVGVGKAPEAAAGAPEREKTI
jgi:hypothetical protein